MSIAGSPGGSGSVFPCQPSSSVETGGYVEPSSHRGLLPGTRSSILARRLAPLRACGGQAGAVRRRKREMIPADKKDATYWDKRRKNNEAAKRSREKRRFNDLLLEGQLMALSEENAHLRSQLLNLHYHTSLNIDKSEPPSHFAASPTSVLAPTLSLSSVRAHSPALFQAGLWGTSGSSSAALMGVRQQEAAIHQFEPSIPRFSSTRGVFNTLNHQSCIPQQGSVPISRPRVVPLGGPLGVGRSVEAEMDPVSSSDDISLSADALSRSFASLPSFLPTFDTLQHTPTAPRPPPNWVVSHLHHSAVCNNRLPWRSSYLATPAVYPGFSLHMQEEQGNGAGVDERTQRGLRSRLSSAPSSVSTRDALHY